MEVLAVSDQVWLALITAVTGIAATIGAILTALIAYRQKSLDAKVSAELKEISKDTKATYAFQNHQMGVALKGVAVASRAKAEITKRNGGYNETDLANAEAAEKAYAEHEQGQRRVDAQALITRAEEQARKLLEKQQGGETTQTVAEAVVEQLGKTHDIEGTVELTPKEES